MLALLGLASLWVLMVPFISPGPDRDFFLRQLYAYSGIALGILIAAVRPLALNSLALVGAGIYGIASAPNGVLEMLILRACPSNDAGPCVAVSDVVWLVCGVLGGAAAGLLIGRGSSRRAIALLAATFALPSIVLLAHLSQQGWTWQYDGLTSLLGMGRGIAAALALITTAAVMRSTTRGTGSARQTMHPEADPSA